METQLETIRNPLEGLGSVLAIRDLRWRVQQSLTRGLRRGWEEALLALDPLTVLRCMRVAHAPVQGVVPRPTSLPVLVRTLGRPLVRRALNAPACDIAGTEPVRRLWLHALATAQAARSLAQASGECDPDEAYVLGLLHDLPLWLHYLSLRRNGATPALGAAEWIRDWNLPSNLQRVVEHAMLGRGPAPESDDGAACSVVAAAELLAELADFWHPDEGDDLSRSLLLSVVTKEDLVAAHNLRQSVVQELAEFGLGATALEPENVQGLPPTGSPLMPARDRGNLADLVTTLLRCSDSTHYRGIVTATTAATLRFLGFERVHLVRWLPQSRCCLVRAKADLSPQPLRQAAVEATPREAALIERALASSEVQHAVQQNHDPMQLLRLLGADEALVVPLNGEFALPSLLVMDRALSGAPIHPAVDSSGAQALAGTTSILIQNLLLKRQRARAQQYALTDPLTRLLNRGVGIQRLAQELSRAERSGQPLTVLMLDMDDFKRLNDTRGHLVGDQALRATADVLRKTLRRSDVVCRYGGEEFMVVLPETSIEEASVTATRIFTAVEDCGAAMSLPLTISIGLASVRTDDDQVESVLVRADRALYASKARGRNRFSVDGE